MEREKALDYKWKVDGRETITQPGYLRLSRGPHLEGDDLLHHVPYDLGTPRE